MVATRRLGIVALALLAACGATGGQPDSGVRGLVILAPTCPVERIGQVCQAPLATTVEIQTAAGRPLTTTHSGADGRFSIALPPGDYRILADPPPGHSGGVGGSQAVLATISPHQYAEVNLTVDSGIR